ncbi:PREDICTED: bromodomain adjacent to zinc finger domain protein 1A-like isoform X2 [Lupinus angustifolius]|uniref:bromodomain adjacent to zinc finger domain protein 1A-like isoform X2 n=1 Tax=Lupinus angustifolius TaxID=3871 RepID=UPI00092ECDFC|nr:PREDICTED: bromodomain adjacent to zinc finger domain protein 1A-like isoform X2 [Lupinus angustifolius]
MMNYDIRESSPSQAKVHTGVSDLMEEEIRVCDTCGDAGIEDCLAICNKCNDGAEHIYCMRVKMAEVPKGQWTCQECVPMEGTGKLVQVKFEEATRRSKKPSCARKRTNDTSFTSNLSHEKDRVALKSQSVRKGADIGPSESEPCNDSLVRKDLSCEKLKGAKTKSLNDIVYSGLQSSCDPEERAKATEVNDSANTLVSKSLELEDGVESGRVDEVTESDNICTRPLGNTNFVIGEGSKGKGVEEKSEGAGMDQLDMEAADILILLKESNS